MPSKHAFYISSIIVSIVVILVGAYMYNKYWRRVEKFEDEMVEDDNGEWGEGGDTQTQEQQQQPAYQYDMNQYAPQYEYNSDELSTVPIPPVDVNEIPDEIDVNTTTADAYALDDAIDLPIEPELDPAIKTRPCAVYYTSNVDWCNDTRNHWYSRPVEQLQAIANHPAYSSDIKRIASTVLAERNGSTLPNGLCKLQFKDLIEPAVEADNVSRAPYKTIYETTRGSLSDWAYCYAPGASDEEARANARAFGDGKGVKYAPMGNIAPAPFVGTDKKYERVAFTSFQEKDLNKKAVVGPTTAMPTSFIRVKLRSKTDKTLAEPLKFVTYDPNTMTMQPYSDYKTVLENMFRTSMDRLELVAVPRTFKARLNYLQFDTNNRVINRFPRPHETTINMSTTFGCPSRFLLNRSVSFDDDTYGTLEDLKKYAGELSAQRTTEIPPPPPTRYKAGVVLSQYQINANISYPPAMNKTQDLDEFFYGVPGKPAKSTLKKTEVVATPRVRFINMQPPSKVGYIASGYIKLPDNMPAGNYQFQIDADDGAELFIDGALVSTHYGYHWFRNDKDPIAKNAGFGTVYMEKNKYYGFRARFGQWGGDAGMMVFWKPPGVTERVEAPASIFFHSPDDLTNNTSLTNAQLQAQNMMQTLVKREGTVKQTIRDIENKFKQYVDTEYQKMVSEKRTINLNTAFMSNDGCIYIDIGAFDASLLAQDEAEDALQPTYIIADPLNICGQSMRMRSPVRNFKDVIYSVMFWIRVDTKLPNWNNILFHGAHDDWQLKRGGDRTPGIWLFPNDTRVHVRHFSTQNANDGVDSNSRLPLNKWVPVVVRMNGTANGIEGVPPKTLQLFIDGKLDAVRTLAGSHTFTWSELANKRLFLNMYNSDFKSNFCAKGNVFLNHVIWYNTVVPLTTIRAFGKQMDIYPRSLSDLLNKVSNRGVYQLLLNGYLINVFIDIFDGQKWACVLNYYRKGNTNPELRVIKESENWPIIGENMSIGVDGTGVAPTVAGVQYPTGSSWGHVGNAVLSGVPIREMLWYGSTAGRTINFKTSDQSVIKYVQEGKGQMNVPFAHTVRAGHNASIPEKAPNRYKDKGDFAMTDFPFWRWGESHWSVRGNGARWEVGDKPQSASQHTIHQVWIRS